ncbi:MAG TPA: PIG-L family deacetylase, partial [Acidobacteriota bacterium]|nr:PIG-L family deacetylase [Acidobacteriota bacterium]
MKKVGTCCFFILLLLQSILLQADVRPSLPDSSQLRLMIQKLDVVGGVLYIGAHPDDENTAVLAAMAQGKLVRTAYLSLTRGDGGQNLLGSEQGQLLGLIRTQELLAARSIDRAQQFFTRAVDFGYTKSPDETLRFWGHDNILADVVWVIRRFRPDVILCRFPTSGGGHGQHTASAILAGEAFTAAADPSRFPEQLHFVKPWQARRMLWNYFNWTAPPGDAEKGKMIAFEAGAYNPLLGLSYTEIAGMSRSMHKSQGFGDSEDRGPSINYFQLVAGEPAKSDLFDGIDLSWKRIAGSEALQKTLSDLIAGFRPEKPAESLPLLLKAKKQMEALPPSPWMEEKEQELLEAVRACAGLWLESIASQESGIPGGVVKITSAAINRSPVAMTLESIEYIPSNRVESIALQLPENQPTGRAVDYTIPASTPYSQPYWLNEDPKLRIAKVDDQLLIGRPEEPAPLSVKFTIVVQGEKVVFRVPVLYRTVDPVRGEMYRRFEIVPEAAVNLKDSVLVFDQSEPKKVNVSIRAGAPNISGTAHLKLPADWNVTPSELPFSLKGKGEITEASFSVSPSPGAASGSFTAEAVVNGKSITQGIITIDYPHIPVQTMFPAAVGKLVSLDLKHEHRTIGYIMGSGDAIPEALRQVGYSVTLLTDDDLSSGDLSRYGAIIAGIRAFNTRAALKAAQPRLLEYVKQGGTYIVQYNTTQELN